MSNLTRYTCVANDHDAMEANPDGEYVRYEQYFDDMIVSDQGDYVLFEDCKKRIEMLEQRIEELEMRLKAGFDPMEGW